MTILLEATRPYERLDVFDKAVVNRQIQAFLAHIRKTCGQPQKTPSIPPVCVQQGNEVQPTLKVTKPRNTVARKSVLAAIAKHGPLTKVEIAEHTGATVTAIISVLPLMVRENMLYIVGQKRSSNGQLVNVYHTDPNFVYVANNERR